MDFTLTDGQKKLVSAFRTFGADTFTPERVAKWCRDQGLPDTVMKEFVDLYYETAEPDIAPDLAHSLLSQVLIVEELSRCAGTTLPFQNDLFNLQIMSGFAGPPRPPPSPRTIAPTAASCSPWPFPSPTVAPTPWP